MSNRTMVYTFKANKYNKEVLDKESIQGNEPVEYYNLYESIKSNEDYELRLNTTHDKVLGYLLGKGLR